jgi:hypothetical protein
MKAPFLLGRVVFGSFFLYHGINHLRSAKAMAPYVDELWEASVPVDQPKIVSPKLARKVRKIARKIAA